MKMDNMKKLEILSAILLILIFIIRQQIVRGCLLILLTICAWKDYKLDPYGYIVNGVNKKFIAVFYLVVTILSWIVIILYPLLVVANKG